MKPILFKGPMVRAILAGDKTQTRRVVFTGRETRPGYARGTWDCESWDAIGPDKTITKVPWTAESIAEQIKSPYRVGDRLWVRETWALSTGNIADPGALVRYQADGTLASLEVPGVAGDFGEFLSTSDRWRPSIHMPRWASRITLEVTGVRVERLQEITEEDAIAEGMKPVTYFMADGTVDEAMTVAARSLFALTWDSLAGPGAKFSDDPWVRAYEFKRIGNAQSEAA